MIKNNNFTITIIITNTITNTTITIHPRLLILSPHYLLLLLTYYSTPNTTTIRNTTITTITITTISESPAPSASPTTDMDSICAHLQRSKN